MLYFSPDVRLVASASFDKSIRIWCGKTGKFLAVLRGHVQVGLELITIFSGAYIVAISPILGRGEFLPRLKNREEFGEGKKKGKREKKKEEKKTGVRVSTGENYLKFASLLMKIYHGMIIIF